MSKSSKMLLLLITLLIIIGSLVWWFVSSQNDSQTPEMPVVTPAAGNQTARQTPTDRASTAPNQPADNQEPGSANPLSAAPATNLTAGNTNDDIAKDLTSVDSQMNNLDTDVANSNQAITPITVQ